MAIKSIMFLLVSRITQSTSDRQIQNKNGLPWNGKATSRAVTVIDPENISAMIIAVKPTDSTPKQSAAFAQILQTNLLVGNVFDEVGHKWDPGEWAVLISCKDKQWTCPTLSFSAHQPQHTTIPHTLYSKKIVSLWKHVTWQPGAWLPGRTDARLYLIKLKKKLNKRNQKTKLK